MPTPVTKLLEFLSTDAWNAAVAMVRHDQDGTMTLLAMFPFRTELEAEEFAEHARIHVAFDESDYEFRVGEIRQEGDKIVVFPDQDICEERA